jgi:hypothetical protein
MLAASCRNEEARKEELPYRRKEVGGMAGMKGEGSSVSDPGSGSGLDLDANPDSKSGSGSKRAKKMTHKNLLRAEGSFCSLLGRP